MKLRSKTCKNCGKKFEPSRPLQSVCSSKCAYERTLYLKRKQLITQDSELKLQREKIATESKTQTLQVLINKIVRAIDNDCDCISCGCKMQHHSRNILYKNSVNAGHFIGVGSNNSLRFNLLNIYVQCVNCNKDKWGNGTGYFKGLTKTFEPEIVNYILDLETIYPELKLMDYELSEATKTAKEILKEVTQTNEAVFLPRIPSTRIELRKNYNTKLNIYQ